ncbi:MAG TPA: hypothetical protein VEA44_10620 [Caulobacter sp.]|nr:hypothetical protein [Caulobacter sp.]
MSNMILAYGNLAEAATLTGGSWVDTLPLTNLQNRQLDDVARSVSLDPAATQFTAAFSTPRLVRVLALVKHNAGVLGRRRFVLSSTADFSTIVHDSGWEDIWPTVYPFGSLPWGSPSFWTGKYSAEQIAAFGGAPMVYILPQSMNAQYLRVEIDDQTNPAGYFQAGRLFVADGWQPIRNFRWGSSLSWENRTEVQEALSGAEYFNARQARRIARFDLPSMSESEGMAQAFDLQQSVGVSKEVLFIFDPEDTVHAIRRRFLGRLRTLNPIENPGVDRWRSPFEISELL